MGRFQEGQETVQNWEKASPRQGFMATAGGGTGALSPHAEQARGKESEISGKEPTGGSGGETVRRLQKGQETDQDGEKASPRQGSMDTAGGGTGALSPHAE